MASNNYNCLVRKKERKPSKQAATTLAATYSKATVITIQVETIATLAITNSKGNTDTARTLMTNYDRNSTLIFKPQRQQQNNKDWQEIQKS